MRRAGTSELDGITVGDYTTGSPGGDPSGTGTLKETTECLSAECAGPFAALYNYPLDSPPLSGPWNDDYCFACTVLQLLSNTPIGNVQSNCTTQSTPPMAFAGQTPMMILSHYSIITATEAVYSFPLTGYRKGILKAQIQVENNQVIDFVCGELSSPFIDSSLPLHRPLRERSRRRERVGAGAGPPGYARPRGDPAADRG